MLSSPLNRFVMLVALPLVAACASVAWLTAGLIAQVTTGANVADQARTIEVVRSAIDSARNQLANTVIDNSYWDDAVRNLYDQPDAGWVLDSYGVPTEQGVNYNLFVVIDRAMPQAVVGARLGQPFAPDVSEYFGGELDGLLDLLPQDWGEHGAASSLMMTKDGLALIAAAPILPTSEDFDVPAQSPRYMVMGRYMTADVLRTIGEQYVVTDLGLTPGMGNRDGKPSVLLYDFQGDPVAAATWTDRRPGDLAGEDARHRASLALGLLGMVMLGIGAYNYYLLRQSNRRESRARHDALHDPLTGLPNRAALFRNIGRLVALGRAEIAVAFADLDGFKEVNDTFDHETGDRLIVEAASLLERLVADRGAVHRLGGDEFVILVAGPGASEVAATLGQDVINAFAKPFNLEGRIARIGVSIGLAHALARATSGSELMRRADIAMYRAKAMGKNRQCSFDPRFDTERIEDIAIANELRQHLARGEIGVVYQPIIEAETGRIAAVEALARWPATSHRRVGPDRFVAVAEQHGLIDELGAAILARACADAAGWRDVRLSVNVSPMQLSNPDFAQRTLDTIRASGLACQRVEIEITEGVLLSNMTEAQRMFETLQSEGVHVALDDFGTGFSSIGYLKRIRFDRIKIDRSLVDQFLNGDSQKKMVQGVMMIARGLAAAVTAEGVETGDQARALRDSGCDEFQGYYFYRPMPAVEISRLAFATGVLPEEVRAAGA